MPNDVNVFIVIAGKNAEIVRPFLTAEAADKFAQFLEELCWTKIRIIRELAISEWEG